MANPENESGRSQLSDHSEVRALVDRFRQIELEVAERRKYEKVVNLLGAAAIFAGVLLGFIGFESISSIDDKLRTMVDVAVTTHIIDTNTTLQEVKGKRDEMDKLIKQLGDAENRWAKEIKPAIDQLGDYDADADFAGILRDFLREYQALDESEKERWLAENRGKATNIVLQVTEHIEQSAIADDVAMQITPEDVFNVAVFSRALGRADLRGKLADAAYQVEETAAARAIHLQSRAAIDEEAFESLVGMVEDLTIDSPQIVVAEAWNAAEGRREYSRLIAAIDRLLKKHGDNSDIFLPSYAIAVKAEAHLRRGLPGDMDHAVAAYATAVGRLQRESPNSQWAKDTIQSVLNGVPRLRSFGADMTQLDKTISSSRIVLLKLAYESGGLLANLENYAAGEGSADHDAFSR